MPNRFGGGRNRGSRPELNADYKNLVATRGMELRRQSYTLRETAEIINAEFNDTLHLTTISKWIDERIKPELEEQADSYRQHLLGQIAEIKRSLENRLARGDDKAIAAWTRLVDREMRLTGVEKPAQLHVTTNIVDKETEFSKLLDQMRKERGDAPAAEGHVIQGELVEYSVERADEDRA